ncbi:uncharacterized protein KGF55_005319 [Candida pseudojiufengensis]|uniref:uncharacterized protein n=1 Tax=Candida pseudojiufengensis TaxID=497109 RepID=UPI002224DE1D|nr:uncharacterized protein KGF55_005319 [Candida pseudojiufengensis]KAI5959491.1 hypothetical protein KGF55_005319 [Candida pseudojiufengensis]
MIEPQLNHITHINSNIELQSSTKNVKPVALSSPIRPNIKKAHQLNHISKHYKYIQTPPTSQVKQASTIQVLPLLSSTTTTAAIVEESSSFDVESPTSDPLTPLSPRDFISPHDPPYEADLYFPPPNRMKKAINILGTSDIFTEYVEDRYSRFRPNISQHNNDMIMNNLHPFQKENYGIEQKSFLQNLGSWFKSSKKTKTIPTTIDLERQDEGREETQEEEEENQENKSNSFRTIIINQEPEQTPQPIYTPRGIPINEYILNYNKIPDNSNLGEEIERREAIINSFDDDIRDLIDGVDNFLTSCLDGIWMFLMIIWNNCSISIY